jgi:selenoprotein W-related protein
LAENIKQQIEAVEIKFIEGSGGAFEVKKDGQLIFSKREKGRFPESDEIISLLKS